MNDLKDMHLPWELIKYPEVLSDSHWKISDYDGFVVSASNLEDNEDVMKFIVRACNAFPKLVHALTMVRDADNDAKADGLPGIPKIARYVINDALFFSDAK